MEPIIIKQEGLRIIQETPDHIIIEMNGFSITLTEENTELLRVMLYEAYRSKYWKYTRKEKSARNKALWALAKNQGKRAHRSTEKTYERLKTMADKTEISNTEVIIPDYDIDFANIADPLK